MTPLFIVSFVFLFRRSAALSPVILSDESFIRRVNESYSKYLHSICGRETVRVFTQNSSRVISGRRTPWSVSLVLQGKHKLGGTLISPFHILTAAHGFVKFSTFDTAPCAVSGHKSIRELRSRRVAFGGDCIRGHSDELPNHVNCQKADVRFAKIRNVIFDGDFANGQCLRGHDWAIIELEDPIEFSELVAPICLPYPDESVQRYLTVSGWGRTNVFNDSDPFIRRWQMEHDPNCKAPWSDKMPTRVEDYLCTKSLDPKNYLSMRTCHGNSGGGIEQTDFNGITTLLGITSYGTKGCPPNELARFTRVDKYLDDICKFTGVCYTIR
ncbi:hypothetical protein QR680_006509 [Steinernema hermaphroditum]|uniref:Peptidase S1 domain-containing protein n=1 Tax=Steinernema hermaphroditum TaxID=289476 RepID=A0AA39HX63_9BILA|nr:hypothetical protein QR680_006509 [Steinernema hermaphroditum]